MRIIKLGIISVIAFTFLITAISLFIPSNIRVSRAIDINASGESVFDLIARQEKRKLWMRSDSLPVFNSEETEFLVDSTSGLIHLTSNSGNPITGFQILPSRVPNVQTVQWYLEFHLRWYPWEKFSAILLDKRYGPILERRLEKLKLILESDGR